MDRLTKAELVNGFPVCYPNNSSGLPEFMTKRNPYRNIVERLKAYEDLDEQGKLAKIPCKLHDIVFDLVFSDDGEYRIFEMKVCAIREFGAIRKDKVWNVYLEDAYTKAYRSFYDFGKSVFLTMEEADAALKELRDKKG